MGHTTLSSGVWVVKLVVHRIVMSIRVLVVRRVSGVVRVIELVDWVGGDSNASLVVHVGVHDDGEGSLFCGAE